MPLRIIFTLFLFMGVFQIYSQSYIESGNLELIAKDVPNGKYIIRIRMRNRPNVANAHSGQGFSIFRNSDKKQVLRRVAIPITNPNTNNDPKYDLMPNLRCDSTVFMPNGNISYGEANFIKEEIYEDTLTLNPNFYNDPQGYTITHTASNLGDSFSTLNVGFNNFTYNLPPVPPIVSLQAFVGLVLWTGPLTVGNTLIKNNSPQFAPFQPEYLCRGKSFSMVVGVTDPDGDELRFSLAHPYAQLIPDGIVSTLSDLQLQRFKPGYGMNNLIDGSISIDSKTGLININNPSKIGPYLIAVKVEEIRDNKVIGFTYRYYCFQVRECKKAEDPQPKLTPSGYPFGTNDITVCKGQPVTLNAQNNANWVYEWSKNGTVIPNETGANLTISDNGLYEVKVRVKFPITIGSGNIVEGCSNINRERVNVTVAGTVGSVKLGGQKTFCNGGLTTLTAPIKTNIAYQWYKDGVAIVGANTAIYDVNKVGKYFVLIPIFFLKD